MSGFSVFAVGDVYLDRPLDAAQTRAGLWGDLAPEMAAADLALCNYEGPISDRGSVMRGRAVPLRTPAGFIGAIADGWGAVSLAQNHVLDYGEDAALDTLTLCERVHLPAAGLGRNLDQAWHPARFEVNGLPVSVFSMACAFPRSFAAGPDRTGLAAVHVDTQILQPDEEMEHPGMPPLIRTNCRAADLDRARRAVETEAAMGRIVLTYVHWGVPGQATLLDYQIELGHLLIEAGSAAVLGTHAHVLQAVEIHQSRPILYGMSHVVMDLAGILTRWPFDAGTYGARLHLDAHGVQELSLLPFDMTEHGGISTVRRRRDSQVYETLDRLSRPLGTDLRWDPTTATIRAEIR